MAGWGYVFSYVIFRAESNSKLRIAIFGLVLMIWPIYAFLAKISSQHYGRVKSSFRGRISW